MSTDSTAARLEAAAAITDEIEAANPGPEAKQAEQAEQARASQADEAAKQWGMLMYTVGGFACMFAPELKPVYSEERCFAWGQQANAVGEKYGWNGPASMPELALIASTAGFLVPTYLVISVKLRTVKEGNGPESWLAKIGLWWRMRKAKAAPAPAAGDANGGK